MPVTTAAITRVKSKTALNLKCRTEVRSFCPNERAQFVQAFLHRITQLDKVIIRLSRNVELSPRGPFVAAAFLHGDVVAWAHDTLGQSGIVMGLDVSAELDDIHGDRLGTYSTKQLKHIRPFRAGMYVVLGSWVGRVEQVRSHADSRLSCCVG